MTPTTSPNIAADANDPAPKPDAAAYWMLASDVQGRQIISVHCKRTYQLMPNGRCVRTPTQLPLWVAPLCDDDGNVVFCEGDVMPVKTGMDLVVMGTAYGRGRTELDACIAVGSARWSYRVRGNRRCLYSGPGTLRFSEAEAITELPIRYENAYGGVDPTVPPQRRHEHALDAFAHHPGMYPRNPRGKGYVVFENRERLDGLELPNIEHPATPVRPGNLVVGDPSRWWQAPIPWSCDWFDRFWYPRSNGFGVLPEYVPDDDSGMWEVKMQIVQPQQVRRMVQGKAPEVDPCLFNAASPALVLPFLRGDEAIELREMTPDGQLVVYLPGDRPTFHVRFGGRAEDISASAKPHRILISADEMGVSIVWQAEWVTPRELPDKQPMPGDDPAAMVGVEAFVDLHPVDMAP